MKIHARKEMIFDKNKPTPACHASTVLPLPNGEMLAAWFGGTAEGRDDVDIWVAARRDGAWEPAVKVTAAPEIPHWNPVLFLRLDGAVCLYFKVGKKVRFWHTWLSVSENNGRTWSRPRELVPGDDGNGRGPVKNKNIRLSDGRIAAPASSEKNGRWRSFVDLSFDDGLTWRQQPFVPARRPHRKTVPMIQPSLWESAPGRVHMLTRTAVGYVYRSDSDDYGETWSHAYKTDLLNNNSGLDLDRTANGRLFLVANPVGKNWGERTPLTLMASDDNGATWREVFVFENEPGEYSYPAIVAEGDTLHVTYTWKREKVAYWELKIEE